MTRRDWRRWRRNRLGVDTASLPAITEYIDVTNAAKRLYANDRERSTRESDNDNENVVKTVQQ